MRISRLHDELNQIVWRESVFWCVESFSVISKFMRNGSKLGLLSRTQIRALLQNYERKFLPSRNPDSIETWIRQNKNNH